MFKLEGKHNEFADEVLAELKRRKVSFHKCLANYVRLAADAGVEIQFSGYRDGRPWVGTVKFNCPFAPDKIMLANPAVVAEICEQGIHMMDAT